MGAGEGSTDKKTVQNSAKQWFRRQNDRYSSKFKFFNSNFKPRYALLISNSTYMKRLRSMGAEEDSMDKKTVQNSAKQWFWRQNDRYSSQNSKIWIQNLNFKPLFALRTPNITYMKRLRSMGTGKASTDEKNVEKQCKTVIWAPKRPLQLSKIKYLNSKFEFQASSCNTGLNYHIHEASAEYGCRGGFHRHKKM